MVEAAFSGTSGQAASGGGGESHSSEAIHAQRPARGRAGGAPPAESRSVGNRVKQMQKVWLNAKHAGASVAQDVRQMITGQSRVHSMQDKTRAGEAIVKFKVGKPVPRKSSHPIARLEA